MRTVLISDLLLNAANPGNLDLKSFHKWQADRMLKYEDFLDKAQQNQSKNICLFGTLFGQEAVPEKMVDRFFEVMKEERDIQIYALCGYKEYQLISYRNDIPENFHLLCMNVTDQKQFDDMEVSVDHDTAVISFDSMNVTITSEEDTFFMNDTCIPSFEPLSFDDVQVKEFGFMIIDSEKPDDCQIIKDQKYHYRSDELKIIPEDTQEDILEKINEIIRKADVDTFLRITITGKSAFGLTINAEGLKNRFMNRVFSLEVFDNSVMDVNQEMFENDISLRSEFVRLALSDESLSESERNRLISYGWNALSGKEMAEE